MSLVANTIKQNQDNLEMLNELAISLNLEGMLITEFEQGFPCDINNFN